jgi:hypothetical protein
MAAVIPVTVSNAQLKAINPVDFVRVHLLFIGLGNFKSRAGARRQPVWIHFAKL